MATKKRDAERLMWSSSDLEIEPPDPENDDPEVVEVEELDIPRDAVPEGYEAVLPPPRMRRR